MTKIHKQINYPNNTLIPKVLIAPLLDVPHALDGGDAIVGNEDLRDDPGAAQPLHKLLRARGPLSENQSMISAIVRNQMVYPKFV